MRTFSKTILAASLAFGLTAAARPTLPPRAAPPPPKLRLGDAARPTRYTVELTVDPEKDQLSGVADIEIVAARPLDVLWLNAEELTVQTVSASAAGRARGAKAITGNKDFVGIAFDRPLPAGPSRIHIEYSAPLSSKESSGASRQKEGDDWYVFTQFEPIDARRVFPCFDEPSFKAPWKLALRVPSADSAFANTAVIEEHGVGPGWKRVQFAESKPLPSYLVAFAVGPFEVVDGGKSKKSGTPVRIIVPKGESSSARFAAEVSHQALERLEEYFGIDYPYGKLDCIAVPLFRGAMENPGLITFSSSLILLGRGEETAAHRRLYTEVATHEFAHQWFGDLVTMAWWDDLWLNEAFASWMEPKIVAEWQPSWGAAEERVSTRGRAMGSDELVSARKIRQPIDSDDDMKNAFDDITYSKGATVIAMFERLVGAENFRRGVQRHLRQHADGNATAAQFLAAISAESKRDIAPAFGTFLDQPGVPIVAFDLSCAAGKTPSLHLSQHRFLPKGSTGGGENQLWQIPVCARWPDGHACTVLTTRDGDLTLDGAKSCPAWVMPNEGGTNYYRAQPSAELLDKLERAGLASLPAPEKMALISDLNALSRIGKVELASILELAPTLAGDRSRFVVQSIASSVSGLYEAQLVTDGQRAVYARYLRELFGARAATLGWSAKKDDDEDARLLRGRLLPLVADEADDAALVGEAQKLAAAWLADHKAVDSDVVEGVLMVAAKHGNQALFDRWVKEAHATKNRRDRVRILGGLSAFRDPKLSAQALSLVLDDTFDVRESSMLLWGASRDPRTRQQAWQWTEAHYDALVAKLPRDAAASLPWLAVSSCDEAMVPEVKTFFAERSKKVDGGPRELAQALEELHLCAVYKSAQAPGVARFLGKLK